MLSGVGSMTLEKALPSTTRLGTFCFSRSKTSAPGPGLPEMPPGWSGFPIPMNAVNGNRSNHVDRSYDERTDKDGRQARKECKNPTGATYPNP